MGKGFSRRKFLGGAFTLLTGLANLRCGGGGSGSSSYFPPDDNTPIPPEYYPLRASVMGLTQQSSTLENILSSAFAPNRFNTLGIDMNNMTEEDALYLQSPIGTPPTVPNGLVAASSALTTLEEFNKIVGTATELLFQKTGLTPDGIQVVPVYSWNDMATVHFTDLDSTISYLDSIGASDTLKSCFGSEYQVIPSGTAPWAIGFGPSGEKYAFIFLKGEIEYLMRAVLRASGALLSLSRHDKTKLEQLALLPTVERMTETHTWIDEEGNTVPVDIHSSPDHQIAKAIEYAKNEAMNYQLLAERKIWLWVHPDTEPVPILVEASYETKYPWFYEHACDPLGVRSSVVNKTCNWERLGESIFSALCVNFGYTVGTGYDYAAVRDFLENNHPDQILNWFETQSTLRQDIINNANFWDPAYYNQTYRDIRFYRYDPSNPLGGALTVMSSALTASRNPIPKETLLSVSGNFIYNPVTKKAVPIQMFDPNM